MKIVGLIPENIRKLMAPTDRAAIGKAATTNADAQAKQDGKLEKQLQENIAALLRLRNIWFTRQRMDKRTTGVLGQPDFIFAINGKACAFEVKLPGNRPTAEQVGCHTAMCANGWFVRIVYSEHEALDELQQLAKTCPHDPRKLAGAPIGQYHCPVCGEMVIAGLEH